MAEALQDTWLAVWKAPRWDGSGAVGAWLWGIAIRRLIGVLRKRNRWDLVRRPRDEQGDELVVSAEDRVLETLVTDGELTDGEIRDQVVTLIGAGFDTTAAALAWTLWCSTLEPDLWNGLGVEAHRVLGPVDATSRSPDERTLTELGEADRVMRETLRLHPPGALTPREAAVDVEIGGYLVPATTTVVWSAHLAGRDPNTWADPLRFDPDRFLDPTDEQQAAMRAA